MISVQVEEEGIPEEIVTLTYAFLTPERQAEVDTVLRALQEDSHLEFMLAVLEVEVNDRPLSPAMPPSLGFLKKLLQALDADDGAMLYASPYNHLGNGATGPAALRIESWDFELGDRLCETRSLRSVRAFLEHGTGHAPGRPAEEAERLHGLMLHGLVGDSPSYAIWCCSDIRLPGAGANFSACPPGDGVWPEQDISAWFHGVFWDDLLFILNPPESTLTILAVTSFY